jgi:hypothetical protein
MTDSGEALLLAYNKGYRVKGERVFNASGKEIKTRERSRKWSKPYRQFNIKFNGCSTPVIVHRLLAYQKFGDRIFSSGVVVRHLDDGSISIGTQQENSMDRPKAQRIKEATKAARSPRYDHGEVAVWYESNGFSIADTCDKFGMARSTLYNILDKAGCQRERLNGG